VIKALNEEGLSIFLVEQDVKSSLKISHYGYVLENGRIVLEGKADSLLNNAYTKKAYLGML
jgi:branched-chain amino acid transport system ATP-binding protein